MFMYFSISICIWVSLLINKPKVSLTKFFSELINVYYLWQVIVYITEHLDYFLTTICGYLSLALIHLSGCFTFMSIYVILCQYCVFSIVGIIVTMVTFQRMSKIDGLLADAKYKIFNAKVLTLFYKYHTLIMLDIFEANRFFGPILLSFLIGAVPTSAYQIVLLLSKEMSTITAFNFLNMTFYQITVVFGFHYTASLYR